MGEMENGTECRGKAGRGEEKKEGRAERGHPWFFLTPPDMKSWKKHWPHGGNSDSTGRGSPRPTLSLSLPIQCTLARRINAIN